MDYDNEHRKHLLAYLHQIERLFYEWVGFSVSLALKTDFQELVTSTLFAFAATKKGKAFDKELAHFSSQLDQIIKQGITKEWAFANLKQDKLLRAGLTKYQNLEALETFKKRKIKDFTVSNRVWDIAKKAQSEIELALSVSLEEGKSAVQLSREVRNLLNNPTALFRRVRDKYGNLVLSKNAQNYHPGQGVYRSAYKNAMRLASNEINVAYKSADWLRIQQNPDIVGFEVRLSPQHKVYDMCDELKGKYPKTFRFHGWHVGCKCHIITILKTDEEIIKELKADETLSPESSSNYVGDVSNNYKQWVTDNKDRFKNWKTKPYFIEANKGLVTSNLIKEQEIQKLNAPYKKIYEGRNKATVQVSPYADKKDLEKNIATAKIIADELGKNINIRPHLDSNIVQIKNPEYEINGLVADRKEASSYTSIKSHLDKVKKQINGANAQKGSVVFDITNFEDWKSQDITKNLKGKIMSFKNSNWLEEIYFIHQNKAITFTREELLTNYLEVIKKLNTLK